MHSLRHLLATTRLALAIAPFALVLPLGNALASHNWIALPLAVIVFAGIVAMAPSTPPRPRPTRPARTTEDSVRARGY